MDKHQFYAIRAAGIGCFITLLIIGIIVFMLSSQQLIHYFTLIGEFVGQSTTVGIFIVASLPLFMGIIFYYFWLWVLK
ncbi:hypothetical protein EV697_10117 [Bisgaardia hudsonensis]|uniref:Uncharacterized protein n=1 Tax=Bisgaardia hudsonensis TaxID=109472 RepID=A0A4R2N231_9PAST|nr:hypothetical protein [Bisgaardia hudsonensis]QLB12375.1 hypothetical protein A6A11_01500 [Bisgaardia hudsonensis]TCP13901.1 hypothetical protein EV697_10117 [Bisgaardia hudsonensis]